MIDWARVAALKEEVGAEDFDEIVELFLEEVEAIIERLQGNPDLSALEADMHFLKGSALNLGFAAFSAYCDAGEKLASQGRAANVNVSTVLNSYTESKRMFLSEMPQSLAVRT